MKLFVYCHTRKNNFSNQSSQTSKGNAACTISIGYTDSFVLSIVVNNVSMYMYLVGCSWSYFRSWRRYWPRFLFVPFYFFYSVSSFSSHTLFPPFAFAFLKADKHLFSTSLSGYPWFFSLRRAPWHFFVACKYLSKLLSNILKSITDCLCQC